MKTRKFQFDREKIRYYLECPTGVDVLAKAIAYERKEKPDLSDQELKDYVISLIQEMCYWRWDKDSLEIADEYDAFQALEHAVKEGMIFIDQDDYDSYKNRSARKLEKLRRKNKIKKIIKISLILAVIAIIALSIINS